MSRKASMDLLFPLERDGFDLLDDDDAHGQRMAELVLEEDNIRELNNAQKAAMQIIAVISSELIRSSTTNFRTFLNHGSEAANKTRDFTYSDELKQQAKKERPALAKHSVGGSLGMSSAVCAIISGLLHMTPKLIDDILEDKKSPDEIKGEVLKTLGESSWHVLRKIQWRECMKIILGNKIAYTVVGIVVTEFMVLLAEYILHRKDIRSALMRMGGKLIKACMLPLSKVHTVASGLKHMVTSYAADKVFVQPLITKMHSFVTAVFDFIVAQWGVAATLTGVALTLASQTGNAVMLLGYAGASASTGTPIALLKGAAARNAALAWLGGGTIASGGGGMAAGAQVLATATFAGNVIAAVGVVGIAYQVFTWATAPKSLDDIVKREFRVSPQVDNLDENDPTWKEIKQRGSSVLSPEFLLSYKTDQSMEELSQKFSNLSRN